MPRISRGQLLAALATLTAVGLAVLALADRSATPRWSFAPEPAPTALDTAPPDLGPPEPGTCAALPARWIVVGWDGASWDLILPLLEAGRLPRLAALMRSGSYGDLATFEPTLSPAVWTTVATGVSPARHRILGFYNQKPRLERWMERALHFGHLERHLFSNADRRAPAVWNLLSDYGRRVMVVGYHNTFPVEAVRGVMVSNYLLQDQIGKLLDADGVAGSEFSSSLVFPAELLPEILSIQRQVESETAARLDRFVALPPRQLAAWRARARHLDRDDMRPYFLSRAFTIDAVHEAITERLAPDVAPDLLLVHFQALDWAAHYTLYFHAPERFRDMPWDAATREALERLRPVYEDTLTAFYEFMDETLGRLLDLAGPDTGVMLLSDHGFEPEPDPRRSGFHDHAPPGILVLSGPGIRAGQRLAGATVYDILPTLMASLELPVADDLEGRPLSEAFCPQAWRESRQQRIPAYPAPSLYVPEVARPEALQEDLVRQLESLGYIR